MVLSRHPPGKGSVAAHRSPPIPLPATRPKTAIRRGRPLEAAFEPECGEKQVHADRRREIQQGLLSLKAKRQGLVDQLGIVVTGERGAAAGYDISNDTGRRALNGAARKDGDQERRGCQDGKTVHGSLPFVGLVIGPFTGPVNPAVYIGRCIQAIAPRQVKTIYGDFLGLCRLPPSLGRESKRHEHQRFLIDSNAVENQRFVYFLGPYFEACRWRRAAIRLL